MFVAIFMLEKVLYFLIFSIHLPQTVIHCLGEHNSPILLARIILRTDIMETENGNRKGLDGVDGRRGWR